MAERCSGSRDAVGLADPRGYAHGAGAVSDLPNHGGLDPSLGIHFDYIGAQSNAATGTLIATTEPGAITLDGLLAVKDGEGRGDLLAHYARDGTDGKLAGARHRRVQRGECVSSR